MIEDVYTKIIKNWYNIPLEMYPIRSHLISSLENKGVYSSVDFLVIIQAVEGFWWRFREDSYRLKKSMSNKRNTSLNTILNELISEFSDVDLLRRNKVDIDAVVDSRHYYSHFLPLSNKPKRLEDWPLIKEAKKLRVLLICCVLSFIGFDNSKIDKIIEKLNEQ